MRKTIVFKIWKFPKLSETFVVNQIVIAKKLGYAVKVLVEEVQDIQSNANTSIFDRYEIEKDIIKEDYKIPKKKFSRWVKGGILFLRNIGKWKQFRKFSKLALKRDATLIYQFDFYRRFKNADVFHIQFGTNKHPVDLLKISGLLKADLVVSFHGHDLFFPINNRIPNNGYYNHLFKASKYLIANTPFLKQKLLELKAAEEKIKVIPVAVDTDYFFPILKKPNQIIKFLSVGRLEKFKGHLWGIEIAKILKEKGYQFEYLIAGEGSMVNEIIERIKRYNLNNSIHLTGKVSHNEVRNLMQDADIFLMTSITDADYGVETQGLVTAEAQACALPVVAFDSGGVSFTIESNQSGFLCDELDIKCMASNIEKLIKDEKLRYKMGENARKYIKKEYSESSIIPRWQKIYS